MDENRVGRLHIGTTPHYIAGNIVYYALYLHRGNGVEGSSYRDVVLSVAALMTIPALQLIAEAAALHFVITYHQKRERSARAAWSDYVAGIPHIHGYSLCLLGLFVAVAVFWEHSLIAEVSPSFRESDPIRVSLVAILICGTLLVSSTELCRRLYMEERRRVADRLSRRVNRREHSTVGQLAETRLTRHRAVIAALGAFSAFTPIYVAFGSY